jgi:glutaredoxin
VLQLYTTAGCHLCEHAEEILYDLSVRFEAVDIADDPSLIERYGVRIPVLRDDAGQELGWPFDGTAVQRFLAL